MVRSRAITAGVELRRMVIQFRNECGCSVTASDISAPEWRYCERHQGAPYDFAADDFAFDAAREREATTRRYRD